MRVSIDGVDSNPCQVVADLIRPVSPVNNLTVTRNSEVGTGYPAAPLDGIWARAPYLNNGSIPTLYHLLASGIGSSLRPSEFMTGSTRYDLEKLGWEWDPVNADPTKVYNTALDGFSNTGHAGFGTLDGLWTDLSGQRFKLSWDISEEADASNLAALLEYLKTL
jgi:hypothetical protein